jgi:ribonucleotide reductase alpha subunit
VILQIHFYNFSSERLSIPRFLYFPSQEMWLRVSIGIHGSDLVRVKETYDMMSQKYMTHATPTLFNAGTPHSQCSSCFLLGMEDDSFKRREKSSNS